ncbi:hypothetical protein [Fulvimonas soli]|jgi:hypothetical protein|uniref:Uncharacterized protein n=1 Tax=Fulvimonas soli TaxID=155197 RepID=A0A316I0N3_9GAMM|nr:hypothetical protein [Fulvimonas soli]PWK85895.1 hypothetical protein C7456_108191 [Fulvimonas soli]TNY26007.1 hypothetical protein BV497_10975 [Fulvimonas soli]
MHLELPKLPLHSLKDFAKHYLMIVLSILTALGLEAWIEHVHHARAAATASRRMDEELRAALDNIRDAEANDRRTLARLQALDATVVADLAADLDAAAVNRHIEARKDDYQLDVNWPVLPTDAWDVAVADQSLGWIDADALQRYSSAYTAERVLDGWLQHDATLVLDAPHLVDTYTDLQLDRPVDPRAFLHTLRQMEMALNSVLSHLQGTARRIAPALPGAAGGHPPAAA